MNKRSILALAMVALSLVLSSCDRMPKEIKAEEVTEETIYMRDDGSAQVAYVEEFTDKYLNKDELKGYIASELVAYNKKYGENAAELSDITGSNDGKVRVVLTFKDATVYEEFNSKKGENNTMFPKVAEALTEFGDMKFKEAGSDNGAEKSAKEVLSAEYNVAVVEGPVLFQTGNKIKYYSGGSLEDEHHIRVGEDSKVVVVYAK